ncbi:hypothetical protein [Neptunomonas antarctica]|uniref:Uncharacterized protein n=1 Tax=Neptunomonas antarctica TaxID=619304 RepID=A0A1N7KF36_9GAMM|nr:hypothetical protein [Neptunomonas antarctica]SIS60218.1 hypothetical protein SAMN05421760_102395 [Neptunomonas antarctica]
MSKDEVVNKENNTSDLKAYPAIISSLRSPLSMFGLAMLICNAVFSLSAGLMGELDAFIYAIHTFLSIVFAFIMIAIWSPRSLYHPSELEGLSDEVPEVENSRIIITTVFLVVIFSYGAYQMYKLNLESKTQIQIVETTPANESN